MSHNVSMRLNVANYLCQTYTLTTEESGAYLLILMQIWNTRDCRLPYSDACRLSRVARVAPKKWPKVWSRIEEFFENDGVSLSPRLYGPAWPVDWAAHPCRWLTRDWKDIRQSILERDGQVCGYCGAMEGPFEIDHIHPRSKGGKNDPENLIVACRPCNRAKRDRLLDG
jgi:hypothetical protein